MVCVTSRVGFPGSAADAGLAARGAAACGAICRAWVVKISNSLVQNAGFVRVSSVLGMERVLS